MKRLHSLLQWGVGIEAVDLQQIDIVGIKALEGGIYCVEYCLARKTTLVGIVPELWQLFAVLDCSKSRILAGVAVALCEDDELVAREIVLLDSFANDLLGDTI